MCGSSAHYAKGLCRVCYEDLRKEIKKLQNKERYEKNKDKCSERYKKYYQENKDKFAERAKEYYKKNRDRLIERQTKRNKEESTKEWAKEYHKRYAKKNRQKINDKQTTRRNSSTLTKLENRIRCAICTAFRRHKTIKTNRVGSMLGCSIHDLLTLWGIEKIPIGFHIDHICPCAQAQTEEELIKLQHYSNLRLIPAEDNLNKSDKKTPEGEEMCQKLLGREWIDKP